MGGWSPHRFPTTGRLLAGALLAILLRPSVPANLTPYVAIGVVVAIDSAFGGFRSYLERTFNDRIFVLAFVALRQRAARRRD